MSTICPVTFDEKAKKHLKIILFFYYIVTEMHVVEFYKWKIKTKCKNYMRLP